MRDSRAHNFQTGRAWTFSALLAHLKEVDGAKNTVLMLQVENEIGMLPVAREYGETA
jgi:hypothetical protein